MVSVQQRKIFAETEADFKIEIQSRAKERSIAQVLSEALFLVISKAQRLPVSSPTFDMG